MRGAQRTRYQYYCWQQKVYEAMQESKSVEITAPRLETPSTAVSVKLRGASVEVYSGCYASPAEAVFLILSYA